MPPLSIKRCWNGYESYDLTRRHLRVDDEHYLILNRGAQYTSRIALPRPTQTMSVFFRPGLAEGVCGALQQSADQALDSGPLAAHGAVGFAENLRPLQPTVEAQLLRLRNAALDGERSEHWLEERLQELVTTMLATEPGWHGRSQRLAEISHSTRVEMLARVDRAFDFIVSAQSQPISLDDMARVARLSKFHLVRVFRAVHGCTPVALLTQLRTRSAARLIAQHPEMPLDEVVQASGFGSRQTLHRQLRRHCGAGGRALRRRPGAA